MSNVSSIKFPSFNCFSCCSSKPRSADPIKPLAMKNIPQKTTLPGAHHSYSKPPQSENPIPRKIFKLTPYPTPRSSDESTPSYIESSTFASPSKKISNPPLKGAVDEFPPVLTESELMTAKTLEFPLSKSNSENFLVPHTPPPRSSNERESLPSLFEEGASSSKTSPRSSPLAPHQRLRVNLALLLNTSLEEQNRVEYLPPDQRPSLDTLLYLGQTEPPEDPEEGNSETSPLDKNVHIHPPKGLTSFNNRESLSWELDSINGPR